ncbi:MAG: RNA-binding S4 domain-containing protein [Tissierellales bacterium]|nr:RNA-binding S4 domain-containing protein [Tissierellales bacterium]
MRIDKFLKDSRIIKRRTIAKEACDEGKVSINGKIAKAGDEVKSGDIIEVRFGNKNLKIEVVNTKENTSKSEAAEMYKIVE